MGRNIHLDDLHKYLEDAKHQLSDERATLLTLCPLPEDFNREEYAFAYVRAERLGMQAINRRLADVAWLPMQLDPKAEIMSDKRTGMKHWLTSPLITKPDSEDFGNDFIHALTRCGLQYGWTHPSFYKGAVRIANLFRDLSCLIGLVYYGSWLSEQEIDTVKLSDPTDLCRSAEEITALIQSPEMERLLRLRKQRDERHAAIIKAALVPPETAKKKKSGLRLVNKDDDVSMFFSDPVTV